MTGATLVLAAALLAAASGLPGLFFRRDGGGGQRLATALNLAASAAGITGAILALALPSGPGPSVGWPLPGARFLVEVDGLSALFLLPLFLVSGAGAVYGSAYWAQREHPESGRRLRAFWGVVTGALALLFVAKNAILFLVAWEVMALGAYFLVVTEANREEVRRAGWVYLVATHTATLALFGLFAILRAQTGSFDLAALPAGFAATSAGTAVFVLGLAGFGFKAGLMPLHVWLPGAHAAAPSHVSALMSGVMIKAGIYGIVRVTSLFPDPPVWWGGTLLVLGVLSGVLGVAFALGQHDLKRLLAYHSVENIGIIAMGVGLGLVGRALGHDRWAALALAGGLLHVVNHALFKSLLFLGAGAVIHATGTREMDRLGGLLRSMPRTALLFLVGAVAISGLPPLNGFVSEWLIYLGLLGTLDGGASPWPWGAFALPFLALVGALALACFVKAFGTVFLGAPRTGFTAGAHDRAALTLPMGLLAACCVAIGMAPLAVVPLLGEAVAATAPALRVDLGAIAPFATLGFVHLGLAGLLAAVAIWYAWRVRRAPAGAAGTWDCGYAAPRARMQYTASSFAGWTSRLFAWAMPPRRGVAPPNGLFPREAHFHSDLPDTVLDRAILPTMRGGAWLAQRARRLQHGRLNLYLLYVGLTLFALLLWV